MPEGRKHVFVIDDDPEFLAAISGLIRTGGYEMQEMTSLAELDAFLPLPTRSCVLADVVLQGESGLSLPEKLDLLGYAVPVVFMTATDDADTIRAATKAGALPCLTKPVEMDVLFAALEQALALSGAEQASSPDPDATLEDPQT